MTAPLDIEGPAAPPRSNGELVFAEPWESRAFGMTVGLYEAGAFTWPQFTDALIVQIRDWESTAAPDGPYDYYQLWLAALREHRPGHLPYPDPGGAPRGPRPPGRPRAR
ncbi:nitrile hydratase accessory protein [Streptomyces mirabilis]|uniref:nitrile hydratase accessory protein n=1 Tax=Streptomyces mirabilis TaxID=68239 RepID=UPI003329D807